MHAHRVTPVLALCCLATLTACTPWAWTGYPRGNWQVAAHGTVHGTELRVLTLVGAAYDEPAAPAAARSWRTTRRSASTPPTPTRSCTC